MKNVLITGGSGGIGGAVATYYSNMGYTVLLHYNSNVDGATSLQQQLNSCGGNVHLYQADFCSVDSINSMVTTILRLHKHIDVLVNNAGVALHSQIQDTTVDQYDRVMNVNCRGAYFATRAVVDSMLYRGSGAIVNVSSIWGIHGASCESAYSMSKHAIIGMTNSLAIELEEGGVTVNCVCPPIVATAMTSHLSESDIAQFGCQYGVGVVSATAVAKSIYDLSVGGDTNIILQIK